MYYLNIFGGLTKPPASHFWWQMEDIWWLSPPNHLICRALVPIGTLVMPTTALLLGVKAITEVSHIDQFSSFLQSLKSYVLSG